MRFPHSTSPHIPPANSVSLIMRRVLYALVPGTVAMIAFFGWGVLFNILVACVVAVASEWLMLVLRKRPVGMFLGDYSAMVSAVLLALALPPLTPWWLTTLGVSFAIIFGKHIYGGLGHNPFNPAMIGYVVLLISFPKEMTLWIAPSPLWQEAPSPIETLKTVLTGGTQPWDAITMATPLDHMKTQLKLAKTVSETRSSPLWGSFAGKGWEWINLLYLAGGLWLIRLRVIGWQIPVSMLGGLACMALMFWATDPDRYPSMLFHLLSGGTMLGVFFIATDPVTAATTPKGRIIYGIGAGVLTFIIRTWGGYPDGIAFSVLLMNMAAPLIDNYTRPRVYGH